MNESSKKYWTDDPELVEKYLLGGFSDDERARMDREISDCEPCREKLQREKMIIAGIRSYGRETAKSALRSKLLKRQSSHLQNYSLAGLAAAVIVIALGVGVYKVWFGEMSFPKNFVRKEIIVHQAQAENDSGSASRLPVEATGKDANNSPVAENKEKDSPVPSDAPESDKSLPAPSFGSSGIKRNDDDAGKIMTPKKAAVAAIKPFSQKVWLIGSIVMLPQAGKMERSSGQQLSARQELSRKHVQKRDTLRPKVFTIEKKDGIQNIIIAQRPLYELPVSRRTRMAASSHIETFVVHNERGLFMTLYNDNIRQSDIDHASVVLTAGDSLIVTMEDQQLVYRLPQMWNIQDRSLRR
ncbi:MAG: hypothetical protein WCT99_03445 [Bacteroidota bacterium]|jgi:hypothetical protein